MNKDKDNLTKKHKDTAQSSNNDNAVQDLQNKLDEMQNNWKRALADYSNLQKRFVNERQEIMQRANEVLLLSLLPVLDNMELLLKHNEDQGFKMIAKELQKIVENAGLTSIETDNKKFDLNTMEAIETKQGEQDMVIETVTKGYFLNGKLIRPAKVVVGKNKEDSNE